MFDIGAANDFPTQSELASVLGEGAKTWRFAFDNPDGFQEAVNAPQKKEGRVMKRPNQSTRTGKVLAKMATTGGLLALLGFAVAVPACGLLPDEAADDPTVTVIRASTSPACKGDAVSPLVCNPPALEHVDCNQTNAGTQWPGGVVPFTISSTTLNGASPFTPADKVTICNATSQWTSGSSSVVTFSECGSGIGNCTGAQLPACPARFLPIYSSNGNAGSSSAVHLASGQGPQTYAHGSATRSTSATSSSAPIVTDTCE